MRKILYLIPLIVLLAACSQQEEVPTEVISTPISVLELVQHNIEGDCWIVYGDNVYDFSQASGHPKIEENFFVHCGKESGFEEAAVNKHSESKAGNLGKYGPLIGVLK